jgi:hypothetical protein
MARLRPDSDANRTPGGLLRNSPCNEPPRHDSFGPASDVGEELAEFVQPSG